MVTATEAREERIVMQSELPRLALRLQRQVADFTTHEMHLEASGHSVEEAVEAMGFLLEEARREMDAAKKEQKAQGGRRDE